MMAEIAEVSSVIILLPIVAGAAGALNIVQSENSSLVSGTAVGLLVAASLAPPAGLIGMALPIGRWDMIENGLFMLLLQLVAIHISGTLVFRAYGNKPRGGRFDRGTIKLFYISLGVSTVALLALLGWQFLTYPNLQRGSISQAAIGEVEAAVMESGVAVLIEADLRFAGQTQSGSERLLGQVFVQAVPGSRHSRGRGSIPPGARHPSTPDRTRDPGTLAAGYHTSFRQPTLVFENTNAVISACSRITIERRLQSARMPLPIHSRFFR
jgi:uncharacterized membrane protein